MFGYVGPSRDDLVLLLRALKGAAEEDPLAPDPSRNQHADGWGYVLYSGGPPQYERKTKAVFADPWASIPDFSGTTYAIFHAREASTRRLTGEPRFQHPFRGNWEGGTVFLAHNGAVEREKLARELTPRIDIEWMVDSEIGLKYILQERGKGLSLEEATRRLQRFTKPNRALNLLILDVPRRGGPQLFVKQFYKRDPNDDDDEDRTQYYQIYQQRFGSGGVAVFSSSLVQVEDGLKESQVLVGTGLTRVLDLYEECS